MVTSVGQRRSCDHEKSKGRLIEQAARKSQEGFSPPGCVGVRQDLRLIFLRSESIVREQEKRIENQLPDDLALPGCGVLVIRGVVYHLI